MKEINVDSHSVPATARSKNYQTAQVTTASSGGATSPSATPTTGGAADTAKVAQNLAADSADWDKILRKDIDERTESSLSIGKDITVDGKAILNDVVANTGTFAGLLKAASATITGALLASTVNATTVNATTFIGELQGNAATATKWKTPISVWGQNVDGSGRVNGAMTMDRVAIATDWNDVWHDGLDYHPWYGYDGRYPGTGVYSTTISDYYGMTLKTAQGNISMDGSGRVGVGTFSPAYRLDVNGNMRVTSDLHADATVGTRNFASRVSGWQVNAQGAADFRNIYADELRVQAFTADISQALAGSDYLTKSVSKLSANFVVPAVNFTVRIVVDDIEGMPATQCFANNDYIRFRAFNRTSGLTIANVWGTVTLDTTYGTNGFSNGTQAYTFTCKATSGAGLTVFKGSEVLDYGTSGSGMISRTTLDAMGSPYEQIATWINDPSVSTNYTVHARLGNLNGIANCNGYGLYTDNGFFTGKIIIGDLTKNNNFLSFDQTNGLQIKLGGTSVATTTDVSNYLTTANSNAQGYANTAQSNAITTASSDATTKTNTAYTNAVSYTNTQISATNNNITLAVNGIQIGGRNLVIGASTPKTITAATPDYYTNAYSLFHLEANKDYIFSCEVDCPTWGSDNNSDTVEAFMLKDGTYNYYININSDSYTQLSTGLYRNTYVFQVTQSGSYLIRLDVNHNGSTHTFSSVMVAEGNKRTTWTPAPEDVDANISSAQSTAISQSATNAAALYVTQTSYNAEVTILQNSISSKVSQTDFNALGTRVGTAESTITQHSTDITSKVAKTDYTGNTIASLINQSATTVAIQASKINLIGAVTFSSFDSSTQNTINGKADSAAHGNFTYIDGNSVYTGTLTADQVNAVAISASSIITGTLNANRIAGNSITGDKIVANSITGDKLVMNTITALGNVTAGSFNIGSGKFVVDANGNLTAINATISGAITASVIGYKASTVHNGLVDACLLVGEGNYILPTLAHGKCVEYTLFHPMMTPTTIHARISGQGEYDMFVSVDAQSIDGAAGALGLVGYHKIVGIGDTAPNGGTLWVYN